MPKLTDAERRVNHISATCRCARQLLKSLRDRVTNQADYPWLKDKDKQLLRTLEMAVLNGPLRDAEDIIDKLLKRIKEAD